MMYFRVTSRGTPRAPWIRSAMSRVEAPPEAHPPVAADWPSICAMDLRAFGADRAALLRLLAADGPGAVVPGQGRAIRAWGFARRGSQASYVGPLVAADPEAAEAAARSLLAALPPGEVCWDILPDNAAARRLAEGLGFRVARELTRMYLGEEMNPGEVGRVYGAAGFELG